MATNKIIKTKGVLAAAGYCRATLLTRRKEGLWPNPIAGGGYLENEVNALIRALAAGWKDDQIRQLVRALMAERQSKVADLLHYLQPASTVAA